MQEIRTRRTAVLGLLWLVIQASAAAPSVPGTVDSTSPPVAAVRPVVDTYHGVAVEDPYRYFENITDPEVASWMKAQADYARAALDKLPQRQAFLDRIRALDAATGERVNRVQRSGDGRLFYLQRGVSDNQYRLVVRGPAAADTPRVLVDPEDLRRQTGTPHAINWFRPSPSGRRVGYGLSAGGSEATTLHVIDVASGQEVLTPLDRADFGVPQWLDDERFTFTRMKSLSVGAAAVEKYRDPFTVYVDLRSHQTETLPTRQWRDLGLTPDRDVVLRHVRDGNQANIIVGDGVRNELEMYVGPWFQIRQENAHWIRVFGFQDGITNYAVHGHTVYALSYRGAPRFRILAYDLKHPKQAPREVVPGSDRVITDMADAADALYFAARDGNAQRLWRIAHRIGATPQEVPLPVAGQLYLHAGYGRDFSTSNQSGLVIGLQSWTRPLSYLSVPASGTASELGLPEQRTIDGLADLQATEVLVKSHDGALVPMSIVHKKGLARDGSHRVWLTAYASYGFTIDPGFDPARLAWLERGGVLAFANPRGSGVFGQAWYEAGKQANKPNTWNDVIACGEYLVHEGWTTPAQLGFSGRSAGGMLAGRVLTERPDLFAAVMAGVGVHDMLRFEVSANGPSNIPEFGSVATAAGFKALLAMSPYHHVVDGSAYPAVLLTHGINDPRVDVWASTKMAARLLAATSSAKPVLLRLQYDSGHGIGDTKQQRLEEDADVYAFFWEQLGGSMH